MSRYKKEGVGRSNKGFSRVGTVSVKRTLVGDSSDSGSPLAIIFLQRSGPPERLASFPEPSFWIVSGAPTICAECAGRERPFYVLFRQQFAGVTSLDVISYLKLSGSRLSRRPSIVSACGYMRKPTGTPFEPGRPTSWAKLYAIQFSCQEPNSTARAFLTMSSSSGRFPGGSSRTTFRTSSGSTGTHT